MDEDEQKGAPSVAGRIMQCTAKYLGKVSTNDHHSRLVPVTGTACVYIDQVWNNGSV